MDRKEFFAFIGLVLAIFVIIFGNNICEQIVGHSCLSIQQSDRSWLVTEKANEVLPTPTTTPALYEELSVVLQYYAINNSAASEGEFTEGWNMLSDDTRRNHTFEGDYGFWVGNDINPEGLRAKVSPYDCGDSVLGIRVDYYYRGDINYENPIGSFDELLVTLNPNKKLDIIKGYMSDCALMDSTVLAGDVPSHTSNATGQPNEFAKTTILLIIALIVIVVLGIIFVKRRISARPRLLIVNNWNKGVGGLWGYVLTIKNTAPYSQARGIAREIIASVQFSDLDENPITETEERQFWDEDFPLFPHVLGEVRPVEKPDIHPQETAYLPIAYRVGTRNEIYNYLFESRTDHEWAEEGQSLGSKAIYVNVWITGRNVKRQHLKKYLLKFQNQGLDAEEMDSDCLGGCK